MKINNKNLPSSVVFVSFVYTSPKISHSILRTGMTQLEMGGEISPRYQNLVLAFDNEKALDDVMRLMHKPFTLDIDDGYIYDCMLYADLQPSHLGRNQYMITFPLSVIKKKTMRTLRLRNGINKVHIEGNVECGVIYEIIANADDAILINGITIKNVKSNDVVIIDGIDKRVTVNDVNRFGDSDLKRFPVLLPGSNTITIEADADVILKYYPLFM